MARLTTWRKKLDSLFKEYGDAWENIESVNSIMVPWLDIVFEAGFGIANPTPFILWTQKFIYFSAVYDGAHWVEIIPRNPCADFKHEHVGGGGN